MGFTVMIFQGNVQFVGEGVDDRSANTKTGK